MTNFAWKGNGEHHFAKENSILSLSEPAYITGVINSFSKGRRFGKCILNAFSHIFLLSVCPKKPDYSARDGFSIVGRRVFVHSSQNWHGLLVIR